MSPLTSTGVGSARWVPRHCVLGLSFLSPRLQELFSSSLQPDPFPVLLPTLTMGLKDKELAEFRSLLQTVFSCLKSVLYCMVAFHTNRGLQAPVGALSHALDAIAPASCRWLCRSCL